MEVKRAARLSLLSQLVEFARAHAHVSEGGEEGAARRRPLQAVSTSGAGVVYPAVCCCCAARVCVRQSMRHLSLGV